MNKYQLIRVIGDGTYGVVYEGKNKETKEKVAIKKLKQKYKSLAECKSKMEIKILETLNHENIIKLKEVIRDYNGEISYIFEYCDCNLLEFIETHKEKNKRIPESIIREIILQLTKGLKYLHSKNYFHRDLKPENILLILNKYDLNNIQNNTINNTGIKVKIADFGTAKKIPNQNALTITEYVCTRWYRSPECVLRTDYYNETSDIWALGCIMAELYKLAPIFPGENEFDQINQIFKILGTPTKSKWPWGYSQAENFAITFPVYYKKDLKNILGYISNDGVNLLNDIFQFDLIKRPSCSKILNHPYFKLIPKPLINNISYGKRNSVPAHIKKKDNYNSSYTNNNNSEVKKQYKIKLISNNAEKNYNQNSLYNYRINTTLNKYNDYKNFAPNITERNSYKNIKKNNNHNNSSFSNIRNTKKKNIISNYIKIINNSNRKNINNNNFKYITINETKNSLTTKKIFKSLRIDEESKLDEINSRNKQYSKITSVIGRNDKSHFQINNYSYRVSLIPKTNVDKKEFAYKPISRLNYLNNNNYLTLNENNKSKKYNKIIGKKMQNLNIINRIRSKNINNNYHIYTNNKNNNTTTRIINTENHNYARKNVENKNKINYYTRNNIINSSNKRNKQRKNYKFSEIHENIKNNNNTQSLNKNRIYENECKCICSKRRNFLTKEILNNNHNNAASLPKSEYCHYQKNLSFIKNINNSEDKKYDNTIIRHISANKKVNKEEISSYKPSNEKYNKKRLINIVLNDEESKLNSNINREKRK